MNWECRSPQIKQPLMTSTLSAYVHSPASLKSRTFHWSSCIWVPFERNSASVKDLHHDYVQVNITLCAVIIVHRVLHHHSILDPYNTALIIRFLETLHDTVVQDGPEQPQFVVLLWFRTGSSTIIDLLHWTCHHTPHFCIQLRSSFQHGSWKCMTTSHMPACLFYKPWKRHAATMRWGPYRAGYGMQGNISPCC